MHNRNFSSSFFSELVSERVCMCVCLHFIYWLFSKKKSFFSVASAAAIMVLFVHYTISTIIWRYQYQSGFFFVSHPIHFSVVLVPFFTFSSSIYTCSVRLEFYPRNVIFKNSEKKQTKLTIAISCWIKKANIVFQIHYIS